MLSSRQFAAELLGGTEYPEEGYADYYEAFYFVYYLNALPIQPPSVEEWQRTAEWEYIPVDGPTPRLPLYYDKILLEDYLQIKNLFRQGRIEPSVFKNCVNRVANVGVVLNKFPRYDLHGNYIPDGVDVPEGPREESVEGDEDVNVVDLDDDELDVLVVRPEDVIVIEIDEDEEEEDYDGEDEVEYEEEEPRSSRNHHI